VYSAERRVARRTADAVVGDDVELGRVDGMVICLERGVGLHMAQLMPLSLTVSCFSKIQIGFTFLVPAHPGSHGKRAVKRVCVCEFNLTLTALDVHVPSFLATTHITVLF